MFFFAGEKEIRVLDMLGTLAENAKLFFIGPLMVAMCPFYIRFFLASGDESAAIRQSAQLMASPITNAATVDPVATNLRLAENDIVEEARRKPQGTIKNVAGCDKKRLTLTGPTHPEHQAEAIVQAIFQQTRQVSRPKPKMFAPLEAQLAKAQGSLKNVRNGFASLARWPGSTAAGAGGW